MVRKLAAIGADWLRWASKNMPGMDMMAEGYLKGIDAGFDTFLLDAPALVITFVDKNNSWGPIDCAIAMGYFDLTAYSAGLGCCWGGLFLASAATFEAMI